MVTAGSESESACRVSPLCFKGSFMPARLYLRLSVCLCVGFVHWIFSRRNRMEHRKRKHLSLSITQKVDLLQKLDRGVPAKNLTAEYGIGTTTIYDIKKQKDQILKFYRESDDQKLMTKRKTLHRAKNRDLDSILMEWIRQRRSEHVPLTGLMIMKQAKKYHDELKIETACEYSEGWLQKFKRRHGIKYMKISGEKASANHEAAEDYIDEFASIVSKEKLSPEQIYNADETSLFWRYVPRSTLTTADESAPTGVKDAKDRLTVLVCANAAGTHKLKLAVIGKSKRPRCFKGVQNLPVHYYSNKRAWVTREIFTDWFEKHFVPAARAHCQQAGMDEKEKIFLFIDNCSAHPSAECLVKNNVFGVFFPPNVTSLIQPCDQGLIRSIKVQYKELFLNCMLNAINRGEGIANFLKEFNVKDAIYAIANAWNETKKSTLMNVWHKLWPTTIFLEDEEDSKEFQGFNVSNEKKVISNLLAYAKGLSSKTGNMLQESDIEEVLNIDVNASVVNSLTDGEIAEMVLNQGKDEATCSSDEDSGTGSSVKIPIDEIVKNCDQLLEALEQRSFSCISEQDMMAVYKIKEKLLRQKPMLMKQLTLEEVFKTTVVDSESP